MMIVRKIDSFLIDWKNKKDKKPLIVKGARQIGKTFSIDSFARKNYRCVVNINFVLQPKYRSIFDDGYEVDSIVRNISFIDPSIAFVPGDTLIFFDELQQQPLAATSLKSFSIDGRYDVICSGSLMGLNYNEIESNSVGYKEDFEMRSLDFEEFLWAKGYTSGHVEELYAKMIHVQPLSTTTMSTLSGLFADYMVLGGMPAVVSAYLDKGNYSGSLAVQKQLLLDYEEDITKYAMGLDKGKVKNVYDHISVFLAKDNKKFQVSKVAHSARSRDYIGTVDWLSDAGIVNVCYCMDQVSLPMKGNYLPNNYKLYYHDTGLLIASLDEEAQEDLRANKNFNTYKGAIYENVVGEMLVKQGYQLFFYRNDKSTIEIDFLIRNADSLIPIEVKSQDGPTRSLRKLIEHHESYPDIKFGIKFGHKNIGRSGNLFTFPYFLTFLLKRFVKEVRI